MNHPLPAIAGAVKADPAPATARVALLGASGYAGLEFLRLIRHHPGVTVTALASREFAGQPATALSGDRLCSRHLPDVVAPDRLASLFAAGTCDTLVAALPHGVFGALIADSPAWLEGPSRILDLSGDHRDGSRGFIYALPEKNRGGIARRRRIANPGCYPTAATLAVLPALEAGLVRGPFQVTAISGTSGAGRAATLKTSYSELDGGASFYKVGETHAHVAEMARNFASDGAEATSNVAFAPQLVPMSRGILATVTATLERRITAGALRDLYVERFSGEPFVTFLEDGAWPSTLAVRGTNRAQVAVTLVHEGRTLLATAAIDNLGKGAAGQAIQNLNLMLGWPETTGLALEVFPW